ncbi:Sphingomyelin phosphodiesterase 2, neutral membrane (Neutral sphingomyelinase) [Schistosoma haematobium]|uniref:Sphingomyelin phosphodiesterase 2, neutral membrane (Neutral sphingomyelinase) n=2 Tax=Schistosoma TaxID=6181 RepID=A0A095CEZ2_SCHHA|nr:Sphingomyelin phosphodiesterase 2, neutral membrane (Neutral sphingomyelinase) [Schistosoma haematobium]XP_051072730.1 Sphingomyelin phosphodiesterase 2, neutral membrane (Neutral sphingomyelinase) [Schistosoma haematobium]CAH8649077.1 unnamed protein product [Schistosoma mattheei]CAH8655400.1 unnamed protein product [Schistosoma intercalatum]KAH9592804.1 Sphingomyelin phosphodiesterase 2, neutral membrane (Neutral sphingomyelinase) [Schistosoma haematobium]KAH9592805.1 Sphingomyelin phosph
MIIELRRLGVSLLCLAVGLSIASLVTSLWDCGNLFSGCQNTVHKETVSAVAGLIILGTVCLLIIILLDAIALCSDVFASRAAYTTVRFIILYLGAAALLIGILVYTSLVGHHWSYFFAVTGAVLATQVAILAIMSSKCVTVRTTTTTRTIRESRLAHR